MRIVEQIDQVRSFVRHAKGATIGLVPTLGGLHAGHRSLVEHARSAGDTVVATLFLNPTQFSNEKDLISYPRMREADLELFRNAGAELVFTPSQEIIYPPGCNTTVVPGRAAERLEGAARPGHFRGVCTVVAKLLNIVSPTRAYFGQKDAQQVAVIRHMIIDLNMNVDLVVCPTIRDHDGVALSSRNSLLSSEERTRAVTIPRALAACQARFHAGVRDAETLRTVMRDRLHGMVELEYASVADPNTMDELDFVERPGLALIAAHVGAVRLIDNVPLTLSS